MAIDDRQADEIAQARGQIHNTLRPTVPALEERLHQPVPCLDHGFVRVVDYMGDDAAVVQAARVSYGRGTRKLREDRGLIRYLMRHRHTTPFEMCELKLHVKLPIFVARQWIRHRTASVNEISGRYSVLDSEFYLPAPDDLAVQSCSNRQGRGTGLGAEQAAEVLDILRGEAMRAHASYAGLMNGFDLARELARINLTLSTYTQWYWKIDLHNLLHFLALRLHPHAQREFRVYSQAIADIVADWVPASWEAFEDYRLGAFTLSRQGVEAIKAILAGQPVDQASSGLSQREWNELVHTFDLTPEGER
jgi:thymidylate synthase (FAD)